jgi:hypothetical protein
MALVVLTLCAFNASLTASLVMFAIAFGWSPLNYDLGAGMEAREVAR